MKKDREIVEKKTEKDKSTNLSKLKREHLLDVCSRIKNKETVDVTEIVELEQFIKSMKYGLNFEQHEEPVDRMLKTHVPVFKEFKEVINNPNSVDCNFLLEGDNLHSLKLLEKTHKGRIDVCYIDPPYNTLNEDFVYGDKMLDENDGFVHSKWLSFMKERLEIARKLLADDGVIFISIDDREQAQLKLLCDEVFGEENFVSNIVWQSTVGSNTGSAPITITENILTYKKTKMTKFKKVPFVNNGNMKLKDKWFSERGHYALDKLDSKRQTSHYSESLNYAITLPDGTQQFPGGENYRQNGWNYLWSKSKVEWGIANGFIEFKKKGNKWIIYNKRYELVDNCNVPIDRGTVFKNLILSSFCTTATGSKEIKEVFNQTVFDYPKPTKLIKYLLQIIPGNNYTILDFFAGSGTTGHAVLDLNKEDGGNRHFILCTNNEVSASKQLDYIHSKGYMNDVKNSGKSTQSKINKFFDDNPDVYKKLMVDDKEDYESYGICQSVTFPRLNTVITGVRPDGTKYSDGIETNLRYFQTEMIDKNNEDLDDLLLDASLCLAELDCMSMIDDKTICVAECDEDVEDIIGNATNELKVVFVADDVFFEDDEQEFFDRHNVTIKPIPDCYYREV